MAVRADARSVRLLFRNEGVVPVALVLLAEDIARLPDWVDGTVLQETLLALPPDGTGELEIPLVTAQLAPLFEPQEQAPASDDPLREAWLPFLTNLNELRDGAWTSRPFKIALLAGRQPWVSPAASVYPFLALERLSGEGIEHRIELHNESVDALDLQEVRVTDDAGSPPDGVARLSAAQLVRRPALDGQRVEAGTTWADTLRLAMPAPPPATPAWFSVVVEYLAASAGGGEPYRLRSRLQGWLGHGPTLAVQGSASLWVAADEIQADHAFRLQNPGQIPVQVEAIEISCPRDDHD